MRPEHATAVVGTPKRDLLVAAHMCSEARIDRRGWSASPTSRDAELAEVVVV